MRKYLSTSEFAQAVGISESTARRLADGGELRVRRTQGGHRKIPVAEAVRYVRENQIAVTRPELLGLADQQTHRGGRPAHAEQLLLALQEGQAEKVIGIMRTMYAEGASLAEICDGPIRYAMHAIGNAWPQHKRSIFVEHRATLLCVRALCQIQLALPEAQDGAPTAMGAAPQEDPYLLPSLMVSLVLHEAGFDETNLGPNTPIDVLTDSVEDEQPDVVWLAVTNPIRSRSHHREIEQLAEVVGDYDGLFLIGGQGANTFTGSQTLVCDSMGELFAKATRFAAR